ncbi:ubiquinol-cytochrome-c reductase complex assembly factor 3-like [Lacerta agilis]|uniref:ubiquinol-cytochrome-c reductase complex assembly factor 3-like n=1 Tax=Lacerta agilis TaxID=80427 RepID=UPI00141935B4|nr:ubiquinol-cytochrome-c reductase complex assembly factor 3-like [Lacerta agilis]
MGTAYRVAKGIVFVAGFTGVGVVLWAVFAPDEARRKEMAKEFAEDTPQVLTERRRHNAMVMEILKEAAKTDENVAHKPWPWKK